MISRPDAPPVVPLPTSLPSPKRWLAAVAVAGMVGAGVGGAVVHMASPESGVAATDISHSVESVHDSLYRISARDQTGTGMLVRPNLILTNFHVINGLMTAGAVFRDPVDLTDAQGEPVEGRVVMTDPGLDVALIEIPETNRTPVTLTRPDAVRAGEPVAVLGFPFGLSMSASVGAVGAVDQATSLRASPLQSTLLQLSLSVNPGNSGGPVLDSQGNVLGMVTFRPDEVGGKVAQGMSFAVPAEDILISMAQWEEHGNVEYGVLGATMTQDERPAEIRSVTPGGAADEGGLQPGDVIVAINGRATPTFPDVSRALHAHRPGDRVSVMVSRKGERPEVRVELGRPRGDGATT